MKQERGLGTWAWVWSCDLIRIFRIYLPKNVTFAKELKEKRMDLENGRGQSAGEMVPGRGKTRTKALSQ